MAGSIKSVLVQDMRDIEHYLEKTEETRETAVTCGILRVLYHLLTAEVKRAEREEKK